MQASLLDISPILFVRGTNGAPSTIAPISLQGRIDSIECSCAATFGFESARIDLVCSFDEAVLWFGRLMYSLNVYGPDAETIWEGMLVGVEVTFGQEKVGVSIDEMANHVRARYTTVLGTDGATAFVSDATSIALYGTKDLILSLGTSTATGALNAATSKLAEAKNPRKQPSAEVATGELGGIQVSLTFAGWMEALKWLTTSSSSTTNTSTTTQVVSLITAYAGTNPFFDLSTANVIASGISDTEFIEADTPYYDKIDTLLKQGNSNGQRLAWGMYEGRRLTVKEWAGSAPATIAYYRSLGEHAIRNVGGGEIAPWNVRPDAMYATVELLDPAAVSTAVDGPGSFYVERTTFYASQSGVGVRLEPQASSSLDARLARIH